MKRNKYGFRKFIRKLEGKTTLKVYCKLPPLRNVRLNEVRKVLQYSSTYSLLMAFCWSETPQGHNHWSNIRREEAELSEEDRKFLKYLLDSNNHSPSEEGETRVNVCLNKWEISNEEN